MSEPFDPYYTWLAIPPEEQPPDFYRLLGVPRFESNPEVIQHASDQRMGHLRGFQTSRHSALSQKLLNEIAAARLCLLNARRKAAYDARLRKRLAEAAGAEPPPPEPIPATPPLAAPPSCEELPDGSVLGEYVLLDRLAASRTGPVYKAQHRTLGRIVAIKLLSSAATALPEKLERFRRKVKVLGRLNHPNLVAAYDAGQREGIHYLIMEYVDGQDLRAMLIQQGPLPVDCAVDYVAQAAAGLGCAHAQGVFHRNVKPSNLLVDRRGVVKVIGLGLARIDSGMAGDEAPPGEITRQGRVLGTAEYMAPEQALDSHRVDARADIYALGCVLYTLLAGQPPYPSRTLQEQILAHREAPIPSLAARRPDVPASLDAVVQTMLAKLPDDRYASMDEVIAALRAG